MDSFRFYHSFMSASVSLSKIDFLVCMNLIRHMDKNCNIVINDDVEADVANFVRCPLDRVKKSISNILKFPAKTDEQKLGTDYFGSFIHHRYDNTYYMNPYYFFSTDGDDSKRLDLLCEYLSLYLRESCT